MIVAFPSHGQQPDQAGAGQLTERTREQIAALLAAKAQRTLAQRKISSQLLPAPEGLPGVPGERVRSESPSTADEPIEVDIRADVTPDLLDRIRALGGTVLNSVPKYRAIRARLPLATVEPLAELEAVLFIRPADEPVRPTRPASSDLPRSVRMAVKDDTTQGDVAHRVAAARQTYGVDGTGIGIGVISDGVKTLADRQTSGDLPDRVTVLAGQKGGSLSLIGFLQGIGGDEGTAVLEIVHDLAPGAELYFATGRGGQARMAENIEALCDAGADVIVDDLYYYFESVFQDGIVAKGVNEAAADGCFYVAAAGNGGGLNSDTAGVWEGDYAGGSDLQHNGASVGTAHDFGSGVEKNQITTVGGAFVLQWADPWGESANDYDLFLVDADDGVLASSTNTQNGTQDPLEYIFSSSAHTDAFVVVTKASSAAARYIRVDTALGRLASATAGNVGGHFAAEKAIAVGAVDVRTAAGSGSIFNGTESIWSKSADGPRRMFFDPDGTAVTAGTSPQAGASCCRSLTWRRPHACRWRRRVTHPFAAPLPPLPTLRRSPR